MLIAKAIIQLVKEDAHFIKKYPKTNKITINNKYYSNATFKPNNQNSHINNDKAVKYYTFAATCNNDKNNYVNKSTNNSDKGNDFIKTFLPFINTFVTYLRQEIIENLPTIINSLNLSTNGSP